MQIYSITGYLIIFSQMLACMYSPPNSFGTLDWNVDKRSLFYLLLVSWRVVFGGCSGRRGPIDFELQITRAAGRLEYPHLPGGRHLVRKSSTDEMRVCFWISVALLLTQGAHRIYPARATRRYKTRA